MTTLASECVAYRGLAGAHAESCLSTRAWPSPAASLSGVTASLWSLGAPTGWVTSRAACHLQAAYTVDVLGARP